MGTGAGACLYPARPRVGGADRSLESEHTPGKEQEPEAFTSHATLTRGHMQREPDRRVLKPAQWARVGVGVPPSDPPSGPGLADSWHTGCGQWMLR